MKAIVLAAGIGSRISDKINGLPKSMLKINGKTIISQTVDMLLKNGFDVGVCVGYKHRIIINELKEKQVTFYYNPFYEITNNIASIWFARSVFESHEDIVIMSADVILSSEIIKHIISHKGQLTMVTDSKRKNDGDYFLNLSQSGKIVDYGPDISYEKRSCEYIGVCKVDKSNNSVFLDRLNNMIDSGEFNCYYENIFFSFADSEDVRLRTLDIKGLPWREIDFYEDYLKAVKEF